MGVKFRPDNTHVAETQQLQLTVFRVSPAASILSKFRDHHSVRMTLHSLRLPSGPPRRIS